VKKLLLSLTYIFCSLGLLAQPGKPINPKYLSISAPVSIQAETHQPPVNKQRVLSQHPMAGCVGDFFTTSPNAFGVGGAYTTFKQNCLYYNNDLNTVLWTHRASRYWNFSGYTTGAIQATWLNLGSNQWDSMIIYRDSSGYASARYPGDAYTTP